MQYHSDRNSIQPPYSIVQRLGHLHEEGPIYGTAHEIDQVPWEQVFDAIEELAQEWPAIDWTYFAQSIPYDLDT